jgi:CubicO group peptidase (beta-lactamase class C family)
LSEKIMIRRRDVPLALASHGLAIWSSSAFAQTKAPQKKASVPQKKTSAPAADAVKADERVGQVLAPVREKHRVPGLIGAIVKGDRLTAIGAVGIRKIGSSQPIQVTDKVHLGSCTTAMTATMIATLMEAGKLSADATIRQVFPRAVSQIHPELHSVTLWQLLTHRAGLPLDAPWWDLAGNTTTERRWDLLVRTLGDAPPFQPGKTYAYSNVGYALAALMAEQVTGRSWEVLMQKRLFEPLGMQSAGFGSPGHPGRVDQPWGHFASGKDLRPTRVDNAPVYGPAGTIHCTVPDWAKFVALHLQGAQGKAKLLKADTFRALHTPPPDNKYAGGWLVLNRAWAGGRTLTHNGTNTAWYAAVWIAPARDFAVLTATNQGGPAGEKATDQAVSKLVESLALLTGKEAAKPSPTIENGMRPF